MDKNHDYYYFKKFKIQSIILNHFLIYVFLYILEYLSSVIIYWFKSKHEQFLSFKCLTEYKTTAMLLWSPYVQFPSYFFNKETNAENRKKLLLLVSVINIELLKMTLAWWITYLQLCVYYIFLVLSLILNWFLEIKIKAGDPMTFIILTSQKMWTVTYQFMK